MYAYSLIALLRLLIITLPLLLIPNIFNPYEFPKFIFLSITAGLLGILSILYLLFSKNKKTILPKINFGIFVILSFGAINLTSGLLGINFLTSLLGNDFRRQGLITLISGIIIALVLCSPFIYKKITPLFRKTVAISLFSVSLVAILQAIQLTIFHVPDIPTYNGRIVGTMGNPNFLGGYLATFLPLILFEDKKIFKISVVKTIIVLMVLTAIVLTDSRTAYLAILLLLGIYLLRFFLKSRISKIITIVCMVLLFLGAFKFINLFIFSNTIFKDPPPVIKERGCPDSWPTTYPLKIFTDTYNTISGPKREALCDNRLLIWAIGLETLSKRPVLGYGQDNFELAISKGKMHRVDNAHNIFLETAMSSGVIGLFIYLMVLINALYKASFNIKMSLISFMIVSQFNPLSIAQIVSFWILIGLSQKRSP